MKNLTLKIDDNTYRKARIRAAQEGTSISAMVKEFLVTQVGAEEERENRRIAALEEIYRIADTRKTKRAEPIKPFTRDEIYAERLR